MDEETKKRVMQKIKQIKNAKIQGLLHTPEQKELFEKHLRALRARFEKSAKEKSVSE